MNCPKCGETMFTDSEGKRGVCMNKCHEELACKRCGRVAYKLWEGLCWMCAGEEAMRLSKMIKAYSVLLMATLVGLGVALAWCILVNF
jgi:ribosomal protein L37E